MLQASEIVSPHGARPYGLAVALWTACALLVTACGGSPPGAARQEMTAAKDASSDRMFAKYRLDGVLYLVPHAYLSFDESQDATLDVNGFAFITFLPDFRGKRPGEDGLMISEDIVKVDVGVPVVGGITPIQRIENRLKFNAVQPAARDENLGLDVYTTKNRMTTLYTGYAQHGQLISLDCTTDSRLPNNGCKVEYFHEKLKLWIFYHYSSKHLASWKQIDASINRLLDSWRVGPRALVN